VAESKRRGRGGSHAGRPSGRAVQTPGQRIAFWLAWWAICFVLWMLLVFKTEPAEVVAGALAAAFAATGAELVRSRGYAPFAPRLAWSRGLLRLPREVVLDTWRMTLLLVRHFTRGEPIQGCMRIVHFSAGARDDPHAQARRAVAEWLGCVSPNTYVIGIDERHRVAVVHQLIRDELPPELKPSK
jgi:multisubunit Na+/H+ antiporter MnhE subunit